MGCFLSYIYFSLGHGGDLSHTVNIQLRREQKADNVFMFFSGKMLQLKVKQFRKRKER